jgi:hypothetical protein
MDCSPHLLFVLGLSIGMFYRCYTPERRNKALLYLYANNGRKVDAAQMIEVLFDPETIRRNKRPRFVKRAEPSILGMAKNVMNKMHKFGMLEATLTKNPLSLEKYVHYAISPYGVECLKEEKLI